MSNKIVDNYLNEIQDVNEIAGVAMGIMSAVGIVNLGMNLYKQFLAKNKNNCEKMKSGFDKQICYVQLRIDGTKKYIDQLGTSRSDCKHTKDPAKCNDKINEKVRKLNMDMTKLREQMYNLQKKQRGEKW